MRPSRPAPLAVLRVRARGWLSGGPDDRARFADLTVRRGGAVLRSVLVVACHLAAVPVHGWSLAVLALAGAVAVLAAARRGRRRGDAEVTAAGVFALSEVELVTAVWASGGASRPLLPLVVVPLVALAVCFRTAVAATATAATGGAVLLACAGHLVVSPGAPASPAWLELLSWSALLVCVVSSASHLASADRAARGSAARDPLTGLYNRRALAQHFDDVRAQGVQRGTWVGAVVLDVDRFKAVNDTHGHERGDLVLQEVSRRFAGALRSSALLHRTGGEEFLVLLSGTDATGCAAVADRLRAAVSSRPVCGLALTVSAGVSATAADAADLGDLARRADEALYRAKDAGRDRTAVDPRGVLAPAGGPGRSPAVSGAPGGGLARR